MTWAGFNSSLMGENSIKPRAVLGILQLLPDKADSVPMYKHAMHIEFVIEGKLTDISCMATMACKAGIFTAGSAVLFTIKPDSHLKRTRYT